MAPGSAYHFAIEDLATGEVVRRSETTERGIPGNLILGPLRNFREWILEADTGLVGFVDFRTPNNGGRFTIPDILLRSPLTEDLDEDGLSDEAEFILGTNALKADTDGDGVSDGEELKQGLDPLDGLAVETGVIGTGDTPGNAIDICAFNDIAIVADSEAGVTVFNVFNAMRPAIIAQVDTPGAASRVACSGDLIAVADGEAGLAIIDLSVPADASVARQVDFDSAVVAVATDGAIGYAGTAVGAIHAVDLGNGAVLGEVDESRIIREVVVVGDLLYILTDREIVIRERLQDGLERLGSVSLSGRNRMAVGGGIAYLASSAGYTTVDVSNPAAPVALALPSGIQPGMVDLALSGSSQLIAANRGSGGFPPLPPAVGLYDASDSESVNTFLTNFYSPGTPEAVSIFNGLAYVADGAAGLQVVNYLAFDTGETPPTIILSSNIDLGVPLAEEGSSIRLTASVSDDVQVRNVEFYLDGDRIATDGNFPFEHRFRAPQLAKQSTFTLRARASDTGGNATWSEAYDVELAPDATPPMVIATDPPIDVIASEVSRFSIYFNEALNPSALTSRAARVENAGPDFLFETGDETFVSELQVRYNEDARRLDVLFVAALEPGLYRFELEDLADLAGNPLASAEPLPLWILPGGPDGDHDYDDLTNQDELHRGTDPTNRDTDGDTWVDGVEAADGKDPLDATSRPRGMWLGSPLVAANRLAGREALNASGIVLARPPIGANRLAGREELTSSLSGAAGLFLARPPVSANRLADEEELQESGLHLATPPITTDRVAEE